MYINVVKILNYHTILFSEETFCANKFQAAVTILFIGVVELIYVNVN